MISRMHKMGRNVGSNLRFAATVAGCLIMLLGSVRADTLYVSKTGNSVPPYKGGWSTASTNIQWALDQAVNGDTVLVADGIYAVPSALVVSNAITLQSADGWAAIIQSAQPWPNAKCLELRHDGAVATGFTIRNGNVNVGSPIDIYRGTLRDCQVIGNSGIFGAINTYDCIKGSVLNCVITNNVGTYAGGVQIKNTVVSNCFISGNRSLSLTSGAGGASLSTGGKLYDSVVSNNKGRTGGVSCSGTVTVMGCRIFSNQGEAGGGLRMDSTLGLYRNLVIDRNVSTTGAGGIHASFFEKSIYNNQIKNLTVVSNASLSADYPGGIYLNGTNQLWLNNTIVQFNTSPGASSNVMLEAGSQNMVISNCCFGVASGEITPSPILANLITADPKLVNYVAGDFRLQAESPCIDAGVSESWMDQSFDIAGEKRVRHVRVDIGAYEFYSAGTCLMIR